LFSKNSWEEVTIY